MISISNLFEITAQFVREHAKSDKHSPAGVKAISRVLEDKATLPPGEARERMFKNQIADAKSLAKYWTRITPEK